MARKGGRGAGEDEVGQDGSDMMAGAMIWDKLDINTIDGVGCSCRGGPHRRPLSRRHDPPLCRISCCCWLHDADVFRLVFFFDH
jgi:hypothetical protein